ncbi:MAG: AtpZ/AtpI family protein [Planctomycetota bacterium]|nr:AtpZ/AtpI family protein [Planctomycetota bacterium]MDA1180280.1 AtpZ/AtpI family protein [Planctomycetota bacterium]
MNRPSQDDQEPDFTPMSVAMEWVSRIMSMTIAMVAPVVLGVWLDKKFGTQWMTPVLAVSGMVVGITYLLILTAGAKPTGKIKNRSNSRPTDEADK